jgi:hypothetical protein
MKVMRSGLSDDQVLQTRTSDDVAPPCPYSEETVVGCRYYRPRSAHGDFPDAGQCADAEIVSAGSHVRQTICRRQKPPQ